MLLVHFAHVVLGACPSRSSAAGRGRWPLNFTVVARLGVTAGGAIAQTTIAAVAKARRWGENEPGKETRMETTERGDSEKSDLRARLETATEKAKEVCKRLQEQTAAAARATDQAIREHPYQAVGIAFAVGLLIGVVATRCRRD